MVLRGSVLSLTAGLMLVFGASLASAAPDVAGSIILSEPNGSVGLCDAPCFQLEKSFELYYDGNPTGPGVCAVGENTYLYSLTHIGGNPTTFPGNPILPVLKFELEVEDAASNVAAAGFIPGPGTVPSSTVINTIENVVEWNFLAPPIAPGASTVQLFVCSALSEGGVNDSVVGADGPFALDAPGLCVGPVVQDLSCALEIDKTCCIPAPSLPAIDSCEGKLLSLELEYIGGTCSDTTNDQQGKAKCTGDDPGTPFDVVITKHANKLAVDGVIGGTGSFGFGDSFTITNNEDFPATKNLKASVKFRLDGQVTGNSQSYTIHTSCSKALSCGDIFGGLLVVGMESTEGGVTDCGTSEPAAAGTQCLEGGSETGGLCEDKLIEVVFEYVGAACNDPLPQGKAKCSGNATGAVDVGITYTGKNSGKFTVSPASNINDNDLVRVTATGTNHLKASTKLLISDAGGQLQSVAIHTSCSQPLACGDLFGSLRLVEFTEEDGRVVSCGAPPTPSGSPFLDSCEVPVAPAGPHCKSSAKALQFAYIDDFLGEGCNVSNGQSGKASCSGVDSPGDPVSITITKDADKVSALPDSGLSFTNFFTIAKDDSSKLGASTEFDVTGPGGTQSIQVHSSCSKPLNLGDRFGSVVLVGIETKDEGFIGWGSPIEYQYTVTNVNGEPVDAVSIWDDQLVDPVVTGETLAVGETKTFFATQTLYQTTINTAMVAGNVAGTNIACAGDQDTVTATVTLPPMGAFDCKDAKPIDELTMTWDGTQAVCVKAWDGPPGQTLLATQDNVAIGDTIAFDGMGGQPGDQHWTIYAAGDCGGALLGTSQFHISCSDSSMNGIEDCDKNLGDGKNDDPGFINDWLFHGMSGSKTLSCEPGNIVIPAVSCGFGPELVLLMPALMWLHRRRLRKAE